MSGGKYSNCSHLDTTLPFCVDKPVRFIIRLLFGFASDSVFGKLNQSTNSETAMLSSESSTPSENHQLFSWKMDRYVSIEFYQHHRSWILILSLKFYH